ncbi:MAG TPA: D-glycero-beta-D-manno-heptose 1-phosphate adenylyltransferase [Cytophagaceae bacterium]
MERIDTIVDKFKNKKVLVIGDAILDTYIKGRSDRLCREAPVPVISVYEQEHQCGGAANTAINVAALGAEAYLMTVTGKDENARELTTVLRQNRVNINILLQDKERTTLAKKRITAASNILLRVDEGSIDRISPKMEAEVIAQLKKCYKKMDAVIISDYGYGVITDKVIKCIADLKLKLYKPIIVDAKDLARFRALQPVAVKPNYEEAIRLLQEDRLDGILRVSQILKNSGKLLELSGASCVAATVDADGTVIIEKGKTPYVISAIAQDSKRTIGAGDTFVSGFTLGISCGLSPVMASEIASAAASIVIQKEGTAGCTNHELKACLTGNPKFFISLADLTKKVDELKKEGKKIVFTNGCFDILHKGHVTLLNQAKRFGDILIVGINSDASIKRLKGNGRPINSLEDRVSVLSGLHSVDYLISFNEDSPEKIIKALRPDTFVKGGDYKLESLPEAPLVRKLGGEVKFVSLVQDHSTTLIINKIKKTESDNFKPDAGNLGYAKAIGLE